MKTTLVLILTVMFMVSNLLLSSFAVDHPQWNLPEGAIARIGKGYMNDIKFSPDGSRIAAATSNGIWIHDPNTGEELDLIPAKDAYTISYSPDGRLLASAGWITERVQLWDTMSGQLKATFIGGGSGVAFSPDGRTLASGDGWHSNRVRLWDIDTGQLKTTLHGGGYAVAFSPDGKRLASTGEWNSRIFIWDIDSEELKATSVGHNCLAGSVSFSPDGRTLATAGGDHKVRLWDAATAESIGILDGYADVVAYSPDSKMIASNTMVWDAHTRAKKIRLTNYAMQAVSFSPDSQLLAGGNVIWDINTGQSKATLSGYVFFGGSVVFSPDSQTFANDTDGVRLFDAITGQHKSTFTRGGGIAFSPDGRTLASGGRFEKSGMIELWDVATGENIANLKGHTDPVRSVAFSPDGRTLASGSMDKTVRLWDVNTGHLKAVLIGHEDDVIRVVFSPDGRMLASNGSYDRTVRLWDVNTGHLKATFEDHTNSATDIVFSPDGQLLASAGGWHNPLRLRYVNTGEFKNIPGLDVGIHSVAFSPDGTLLACGDSEFKIQLVDVATGAVLETINGHGSPAVSIAFSPNGQRLASVGFSGALFLWDLTDLLQYTLLDNTDDPQSQGNTLIKQYERELVRLIYFCPNDRLPQQSIDTQLDTLIRDTQYFYTQRMHEHGGKTFAFETDPVGNARVHHITGKFDDAYYHEDTYHKVIEEVTEQFDTSTNAYLIAVDISTEFINDAGTCGIGGGGWRAHDNEAWLRTFGGTAVIPASGVCFGVEIAAHELGHVFGLQHDFRDDTYLMAYGTQERLSRCAAEWLAVHRFFNNDPTFFDDAATLEMRSSRVSDANTRQLQFELTDPDGLHQVQLLIPATATDPAPGEKLQSCRSLNGTSQSVGFTVTGLAAAPGTQVTLQIIDTRGNITKEQFPIILEEGVVNASPVAVDTIPDPTLTPGATTMLNASIVPTQTHLLPNYPNPFNPETWIPYHLSESTNVLVSIYAVDGKLVRSLEIGDISAGIYQSKSRAIYWDGRNEVGDPVASGVYFYTLTAGDFTATRKMLIKK